jgi:Flp pilus assembly protein TadD
MRLASAPAPDVRSAYQAAIRIAEESRKINGGQPRTLTLLAIYYACTNRPAHAMELLKKGVAKAASDPNVLIDAAIAYERMGQRASAARQAEQALEAGVPWEDLRDDPDLQGLIESGALRAARTPKN